MTPAAQVPGVRIAASLLTAVGLGLALWLTVLKWGNLPCLGGGCEQVIQSRYGSVAGVPVGVFGAALWLALALRLPDRARRTVHATLALGALGFMVVQFGVLRAFCPYCTAHAIAAVTAWRWRRVRPAAWAVGLGLLLAAGGFLLAQRAAERRALDPGRPAILTAAEGAVLPFDDALPSGPVQRPVLVLSLSCPTCLDLLHDLTAAPWPRGRTGAALYLRCDARDRSLAETWLAACQETAGSTARDRWVAVTALLVAQRELVAADPAAASAWLAGVFQPSDSARRSAARQLDQQAQVLAQAGVVSTPWFLPASGAPRSRVIPADLWP
jgi:uncharacterized membrane protein